jgi:hypothetical protein
MAAGHPLARAVGAANHAATRRIGRPQIRRAHDRARHCACRTLFLVRRHQSLLLKVSRCQVSRCQVSGAHPAYRPPEAARLAQPRGGAEGVLQSTARPRTVCHDTLGLPHQLGWTCTMPLPCNVPVSLSSWLTCSCLGGALLFGAASLRAEPSTGEGWTVATLARDGSWGVATESSLAHAIGMAVSKCKTMAVPQSDCGAQFTTIRTGWTLALLCGDHKVLAAAKRLDEAWLAVQFRLELKRAHLPDLPPCRQIFTVDPAGEVILSASEPSTALSR